MADKIILVVKDEIRKDRYQAILDTFEVSLNVVASLKEAINLASEEPHNGLLIDLPLLVRAPQVIKFSINDLLNGLPSGTLNIHAPSGEIRLLQRGDRTLNCSSVEQFVEICAKFHPKIIFSKKRVQLHYNVLLATTPDFRDPDRSVCMDISTGGCFLIFLRPPHRVDIAVGSTVWIKMIGLNNGDPIEAVVRWMREWGTTHNIPGIGVEFQNLSDDFRKQIGSMARY